MKKQWLTEEVLEEVLAGKSLSEASRRNLKEVFKSFGALYRAWPSKVVELNRWLVSLTEYSDTTIRLWFTILRSAYEFMEVNYKLVNPFKVLAVPKVKKRQRRYHSPINVALIIGACRGDYEYALVMTFVDSGCRVGGLAGLKGRDVKEGWLDVVEKTGERRYRLDVRLCERLKALAGGDDNYVFGGVSANALSMRIIRISRRAGLSGSKLGAHTLRHTSASLVAKETESALAVKALLQQDSIQSAMVYIHDVEEDIQKRISPLKLLGERLAESGAIKPRQLTMGRDSEAVEGEVVGEDGVDAMMADMFPVIPSGVGVHTTLKCEDLDLIRLAFIELASSGRYLAESGRARLLMKRMLRKVK